MLGKLLKTYLAMKMPKPALVLRHPIRSIRAKKVSYDLRHAYAPRVTAVATALLVGPLAYRLGRRSAEGTLFTPRSPSAAPAPPAPSE